MRKLLIAAMLLYAMATQAQPYSLMDTLNLRNYINTYIVPNSSKAITATMLNKVTNGNLNVLNIKVDSVWIAGDSLRVLKAGRRLSYALPAGGGGSGTNLYNGNGTLTASRTVNGGGYNLTFTNIGDEFTLESTYGSLITDGDNMVLAHDTKIELKAPALKISIPSRGAGKFLGSDASGGSTFKILTIADISGLTAAMAAKQDALVSGTSLRTVNGNSLLGSGNVVISGGIAPPNAASRVLNGYGSFVDIRDSVYNFSNKDLSQTANRTYKGKGYSLLMDSMGPVRINTPMLTLSKSIQLVNDATMSRNVIQSGDPIDNAAAEGSISFATGADAVFELNSGDNNIFKLKTDADFEWFNYLGNSPPAYVKTMSLEDSLRVFVPIRYPVGSPGVGKVLTDINGNGVMAWQTPSGGASTDTSSLSIRINLKKNIVDSTTTNPANYVTQYQRKKSIDSLAASIPAFGKYKVVPTAGQDSVTATASIGRNANDINVFRDGFNYNVITTGTPTANDVKFNTATGGLKFGQAFGAYENIEVLVIGATAGGGGGSTSIVKQIVTSGSSATIADGTNWLIVNLGSTASTFTITFPSAPTDAQPLEVSFGGTISSGTVVTALTLNGNSKTILQASTPTLIEAGEAIKYRYNSSNNTWYRIN